MKGPCFVENVDSFAQFGFFLRAKALWHGACFRSVLTERKNCEGDEMMQHDFDRPIDRWNNFATKYDEMEQKFGRRDLLPMWIADMDLMTAQPILDAIDARNRQGIFGYTSRPDSYFQAVCDWQEKRHGWKPAPEQCVFSLGVVPTLCTCVREFSQPGDEVLFMTPVYGEFFESVENWGRKPLTVPLKEDDGVYSVDFDAFENALKRRPPLFILCNPHNPVGRCWTEEELRRMGELCVQYGALIISDEIHSDLILFGNKHIPMASVSEEIAQRTITCTSATKTFNLAGLQAATIMFPNQELIDKYQKFWKGLDVHRNNCFSLVAVEAAFCHGEEWLDQLLAHLEGNVLYVEQFLRDNIPEIVLHRPQCTYLLWLNCKALGLEGDELPRFIIDEAKLALNDGRGFGPGGEGYMRMNIACSRSTVERAMARLKAAVDKRMGR